MRTRFTCSPLFAPLALAALGLACGPTDTVGRLGDDCTIDDDCAAALRCSFGECTTETGGGGGGGGGEGESGSCATTKDCVGLAPRTACDTSIGPGVCVAPTCAETVHCHLSDLSAGSPIVPSGGDGCDEGEVEFVAFAESETYCGVSEAPEDGFFCADVPGLTSARTEDVDGNVITVCVINASECVEGVCSSR